MIVVDIIRVASIAELRALAPGGGARLADVQGYHAAGDYGGGWFDYAPDCTAADDGFAVIAPARPRRDAPAHAPGRWRRRIDPRALAPEMAGARGDNESNDYPAFAAIEQWLLDQGGSVGGRIRLSPGRMYWLGPGEATLGFSHNLIIEGADGAQRPQIGPAGTPFGAAGIALTPMAGIKSHPGLVLKDLLIVRHGLRWPATLSEVRAEVDRWVADGQDRGIAVVTTRPTPRLLTGGRDAGANEAASRTVTVAGRPAVAPGMAVAGGGFAPGTFVSRIVTAGPDETVFMVTLGSAEAATEAGARLVCYTPSCAISTPFQTMLDHVHIVGFGIGFRGVGHDPQNMDRVYIDCAIAGLHLFHIFGNCNIRDVHCTSLWCREVPGEDALGLAGWRPGVAFALHDHTDGSIFYNCNSHHWRIEWCLTNVWLNRFIGCGGEPYAGVLLLGETTQNEFCACAAGAITGPNIASYATTAAAGTNKFIGGQFISYARAGGTVPMVDIGAGADILLAAVNLVSADFVASQPAINVADGPRKVVIDRVMIDGSNPRAIVLPETFEAAALLVTFDGDARGEGRIAPLYVWPALPAYAAGLPRGTLCTLGDGSPRTVVQV